jgi:2-polyprenyl-3-methyl-5-hydroxy-6-metoxy-1,4-benzoquinol methylase
VTANPVTLSIDTWIDDLRDRITQHNTDLLDVFETYANEAKFGYFLIQNDIVKLPQKNAALLEIGAGSLILSCYLTKLGYTVTALEPVGEGFSHFDVLRSIILESAKSYGGLPSLQEYQAEQLEVVDCYDYAFSINVMEHVKNVEAVIENVMKALHDNGSYRFICPNYHFPYEPHFDIPIIFSKTLTERLLKNRIFNNATIPDAQGTWLSLNWISVSTIEKWITKHSNYKARFNRELFAIMILRAVSDPIFAARRSPWLRMFLNVLVNLGVYRVLKWIPVKLQPVMDCTIVRDQNYRPIS